ncbi:MAG: GntR family transcriptional regulator [Lachnospiraceae bacterium]|nr:GntR family transcriptional regulator [Lachnospiraceae bacterium]
MSSKSPLQIQAYEYLKEQILTGKLEADTLYSETQMSAEIGISRTPMREAIQCLSQDGYISVVPSKGFKLRQLNEADMEETIQVRCAIEGFCVHMIAAECTTKKGMKLLNELERLLEKQEKALSNKKEEVARKQFMEYDHQFHLALINYADNAEFRQTFQRLMYLIHLTTVSALSVPGRSEDTLREHKLFFSHLQEGDGDSAYKLILMHLMTPLTMHIV